MVEFLFASGGEFYLSNDRDVFISERSERCLSQCGTAQL